VAGLQKRGVVENQEKIGVCHRDGTGNKKPVGGKVKVGLVNQQKGLDLGNSRHGLYGRSEGGGAGGGTANIR